MVTLLLASMLTLAFNIQTVIADRETMTLDDGPFIYGPTQDPPLKIARKALSTLAVDIIHPQPGQFSNYSHYYSNGTDEWYGWWNTSYTSYVQPHVINTTHAIVRPVFPNGTFWCTVDTTNRWVTNTDPEFWWNQSWYGFWIETNVTIGSVINWWTTNVTINGSRIVPINGAMINTWFINLTYGYGDGYDLLYFDKQTGVLVAYVAKMYDQMINLTLTRTNIPIGEKLSTSTYFNLNPNPATIGQKVTLKGILVDEFSQRLSSETVKIYARPLAGSWTYITSLTTNVRGIFNWQATIPVTGTFVFAVYYPESEMYESTYNLAALIVQ